MARAPNQMLKKGEQYFVGQVNQKALIYSEEGKILLVKYPENDLTHHPNPKAWGRYDMPGGRFNKDENPIGGLKREVLEETRAEIIVEKIITTGTFINLGGQQNFFIIYRAKLADGNESFRFNDGEVAGVYWFSPEEFLTLPVIYPEYQEALKSFLV